jgi:ferredoxin-NADP reductase
MTVAPFRAALVGLVSGRGLFARSRVRALLIATGGGTAQARTLLEELPPGSSVICRADSTSDVIFSDELNWLARTRQASMHYVVAPRGLSAPGLASLVPDIARREIYLCGPDDLVTGTIDVLRSLRVPRRRIHADPC